MREKIKNALEALGFELTEMPNIGCKFQYEGYNYLWLYSKNDENFLNISLPVVLDLEDDNEMHFYKLMDHLNGTLKYVKVNQYDDSMWFFYERELIGDEDIECDITRMIANLYHAVDVLHKTLKKAAKNEGVPEDNEIEDVVFNNKDDVDNED